MINEVRASVCSPRARRTLSKYKGTSFMGSKTEFPGLTSGLEGLNTKELFSSAVSGELGRDAGGLATCLGF